MTSPAVPIGVGTSFANLIAGQKSPSFTPFLNTSDQGGPADPTHVVSFKPIDPNNPGVLTIQDAAGNVVLTMNTEGLETWQPTAGTAYYFIATLGATQVSAVMPSVWR